jgi:hypothetical protein
MSPPSSPAKQPTFTDFSGVRKLVNYYIIQENHQVSLADPVVYFK